MTHHDRANSPVTPLTASRASPYRPVCVMKGRQPLYTADIAERLGASADGAVFAAASARPGTTGRAGPGPRPSYTADIAELILDERAGGRTLTDVCRDPAMPAAGTVRQWVRDDRAGFAAHFR